MGKISRRVFTTLLAGVLSASIVAPAAMANETGEVVLADTDDFTLSIVGMEDQGDYFEASFEFTNKTDVELDYDIIRISIDGFGVDNWGFEVVDPNGTTTEEVTISYPDTGEEWSIDDITDLQFMLSVDENEEYETIYEEYLNYYPKGEENATVRDYTLPTDAEVLVDDEQITFAVLGYAGEDEGDFEIDIYIENKTDSALEVYFEDTALNGWMTAWGPDRTIAGGIKMITDYTWWSSDLEEMGIEEVTEIVTDLSVNDVDGTGEITRTPLTIYPKGVDAVVPYEFAAGSDDLAIFDENGVKVITRGWRVNDFDGLEAKLYIENNTDSWINVEVTNASFDGVASSFTFFSTNIRPGSRELGDISWFEYDLENAGTTADEVDTVTVIFNIMNSDDKTVLVSGPYDIK